MATAKTAKGFKVSCPFCGASPEDASITLALDGLEMTCGACDETFTVKAAVARAAELAARWEAVARWIDAAGEMLAE